MLGSLATWLRILGYDTLYSPDFKDEELLDCTRIVLTRDKQLYERLKLRGKRVIFIESIDVIDQVAEVLSKIGVKEIKRNPVRCPVCNGRLKPVSKKEVKGLVPPKVYERREIFRRCEQCGKIYRIGKHRLDILEKIEKIRRKLLYKSI